MVIGSALVCGAGTVVAVAAGFKAESAETAESVVKADATTGIKVDPSWSFWFSSVTALDSSSI
jgi:hypothetical protein